MMKTKNKKLQKKSQKNNPQKKLLIKDHFKELVKGFYWWVAFFVLGSILGYLNYEVILGWLIQPLKKPLFYTSPIGGFEAVFGVSILLGFVVSLPILVFQIVKFIEPVSNNLKGKKIFVYLFTSFVLAVVGISVSYYLVFPASLNFLSKFGSDQLEPLISTKDYFSFVTKYLLGFAVLFQLPLVIYLVSLFTPITPKLLLSKFKYVFAVSFLVAAVLTPTPDFINQTIMATPIILLYLVTILILYVKKNIVK
ncbi:twin-arginine translocase subunit TatC [Patescibacteria group bacterium]|nr:twin-arginine translocase subunit TatC [Patescibacteria group bacterium]MBU0777031.1 twin-arginine translocase subunit TatC [Patescibacteria group bacterium]MBU0846189.1 twin-arginine translocase subunit TatC [Patescibacteria group bacterium]MBU1066566.1 twin-arginine translocase subunit TatC [Patescibacteria group bacterium]MBU1844375.1 twin-arginine translocase subunit TatC [Patescibacteria group bacterium]